MNNTRSLKILLFSPFSSSQIKEDDLSVIKEQEQALNKAGHKTTLFFIGDYSIRKSKELLEEMVEKDGLPDIIHAHSYLAGKICLWFHTKFHVPIVTSEYHRSFKDNQISFRRKKIAFNLYRFSSTNLTSSNKLAIEIQKETGVPFSILTNHDRDHNDKYENPYLEKSIINSLEELYYSIVKTPDIIQASSTISQQGGICKVAYLMGVLLSQHNYRMTTFTSEFDLESIEQSLGRVIVLKQPKWVQKLPAYLRNYYKSLFFTNDVHSIFKEKNKNPNCITISHRDSLGADIAIGHSCHKESVNIKKKKGNPFWILNPIHHLYLKQEKAICNTPGTRLIAISTAIAGEYHQHYGITSDFIDVIPNGVDLDQFNFSEKSEDRQVILQELKIQSDAYLLLFVGNEFRRKGLDFIIDAMSLINDKKLHLMVLGHADKSSFLKKAEQYGLYQNVHFLGRRSDAPKFFSGSDIFIIPADYEPFGLVGIEAMSCGTPILATRLGGFLDYLKDGENGYFIERDSDDIAEKICVLKERDNNRIDEMSINARKTAEQFSWSKIGLKYSQVIEKTISSKR